MPSIPLRRLPLAISLAIALSLPVATASAHEAQDPTGAGHDHDPTDLARVEVRATPLAGTADNLVRPVEVLTGEALDAAKSNSLGETVDKLPGVQSSYFGPGVGRPIIRGFDGARVQVLSDGLGSGDVSTISADHAVSIEPFLADQVEVLKGPATLLYGSGAIGGAVNVIDGRIPETTTLAPLEGRAELRAGTVNDQRTGMVRLDGTSASGNVVFHFDALHRETGDYEIPGFAESEAAHAEHEDEADHEEPGIAGILPGSAIRTDSAALGVSWIGDRGFLGAGYSLFNSRYGVPGHAHEAHDAHEEDGHEDEHAEEPHAEGGARIVMDQRRSEMRGGLDDLGAFESLRVKLARTEYTHTEFEGDAVGTVFDNTATEARVELVHQPLAGWDGALGVQWSQREFLAIGDEAFVPGSDSRDAGLFWIGERAIGPTRLELGARHDRSRIDIDDATAIGPDRDFDTTSLSAALRWDIGEDVHLSFGLDRAQRAPTAEELYSSGMHVATGSIELGDPDMDVETANRAEVGVHWHNGPLRIGASVFQVRFDDFVYLADTGIVEDGLPVRAWTQHDARFNGAEAELDWTFVDNASGAWTMRVFGDVVHAELDGSGRRDVAIAVPHGDHDHHHTASLANDGHLPRIAPARAGAELRWETGSWRASLGAVRYMEQDDVAEHETATPGYTLVDAHLAWHADTRSGNAWEVFVDGSNLLDEEARPHTSFLKDLAPLPGRGIEFGVRAFF
ncbi:membrane protein [Lysobacter arseniciresistens ZS79]|uniref:Membrane protein n=1 Tax=Lysobacter arseniciresistens ZS79 TaxID=913325 RepID=A0A0A0F6F8_9GAMM|nr:TonB-dependent receptor [Lysobacter arseniciresistens]KGM56952.1 membrane protein [Lysobacter arseniciresistens ZS79]